MEIERENEMNKAGKDAQMRQPVELLAQVKTIGMDFHDVDPLDAVIQNIIAARVLVNFAMDALNATDKELPVVGDMTKDADNLLLSITHTLGRLTGRETSVSFVVKKQDKLPRKKKKSVQ